MQDLVKFESGNKVEVTLSKDDIKRYLCPLASDQEIAMFMQLCLHQRLNPWLREAYLIKYGGQPASMVVGWHVFISRADSHPQFDGYETDVYDVDGKPYRGRGEIGYAEAKVYRKDRKFPTVVRAIFAEYSTGKAMWAKDKIPSTMIRKVALAQALRESFTKEFSGIYTAEEMRMNPNELPTEPVKVAHLNGAPVIVDADGVLNDDDGPDEPDTTEEVITKIDLKTLSPFAAIKYMATLHGPKWAAEKIGAQTIGEYYFQSPVKNVKDLESIVANQPTVWEEGSQRLITAYKSRQ